MKRVYRGGYVSFYRNGFVIHFTPEQYACRHATAVRLAEFRRNTNGHAA